MTRDAEDIDAELRLVAAVRAVCDPPPSTTTADELLDERLQVSNPSGAVQDLAL